MADEHKAKRLEIAHVLFMDIVGYSKLLTDEQSEALQELNQIVRSTEAAREADAAGELTLLPTGDGMALVFTGSVEEPAECALEISRALRAQPSLPVRMGIHSGPIHHVKDANGRENIAGVGINIAQRVMDCGDAGHILVSKRVADDLAQQRRWQPYLHELGDVEVKHGFVVSLVNLYAETIGNPTPPTRLGKARGSIPGSTAGTRKALSPLAWAIFIVAILLLVLAIVSVIFAPAIMRTLKGGLATLPQPSATAAPSLADTIKSAVAKKITDELQGELSRKKNAALGPTATGSAIPEKSIAVLPFENLSNDKNTAYFSDGITEEILNALAQIPNLKVAARRSAFQFKGNDLDLRKIGQVLGVAHILEGSLQKAGDQVRINVQLVDVQNGLQAWSEKYDRKLDNVFAVEDEIAKAIATKLRVQLTGGAGQPLVVDSTNNPQAHELYLRGLTLLAARGPGLREASDLFQQAVKLDASYAQAWGALAITELLLPSYGLDSFDASFPRGESAAQRALSLDSNTASAYVAVGLANTFRCRWPEADQAYRRALVLAPGDAEAVNQYAQFLSTVGQLEASLREIEHAQQLDPLSPIIGVIHAGALAALRRDDAAEAQIKRILAAHPEFGAAHTWAAAQYIDRKMYPEAEAELRSLGKLKGQNEDAKALLVRGMADPAQRTAALNSLETSPENADLRQDAIWYAFYLISLGERGRALDELEIYAVKHNSAFGAWLWDRAFDPLRDESRFKAVLAKLALPYTPPAATEP
jgi:TolB-like protein/class 3 adenylate cyclase/Tfp pilus assembly protein PilF